MKFIHVSDLHIGKRVNEFSMIEDQKVILQQILDMVKEHKPNGVLLAGDIYDKSIPSVEGVNLFDRFLTSLYQMETAVFLVSGNHDGAERLNFATKIMEENKVFLAGVFDGKMKMVTMEDEFGPCNVYLLPFVKPGMVTPYYPEVETYEQAVEAIITGTDIEETKRNILVAHQFVISGKTSPMCCDSEQESIGGLDHIDARVFDAFDYVALGHLHQAQRIGRDTIRYAGSPLKYSFSEVNHKKSVTMVTLGEKGEVNYELLPLIPMRDMREIKGPIDALVDPINYTKADTNDYIHATLTDEDNIIDAIGKLRSVYPNVMRLDFENSRTAHNENAKSRASDVTKKNPMELFEEFYENQNNSKMSEAQREIMSGLLERLVGEQN